MIRNLLAMIGFVAVAMAAAAGGYATSWGRFDDWPSRLAVSTAGLDLTSPYGRWSLRQRVNAAIERVCESHGTGLSLGRYGERDCRRRARAGADPQIARAIDRAFDRQRFADDDAPIAPDDFGPAPAYEDPPAVTYPPARYASERNPERNYPERDYPERDYDAAPPVRYVQPIDDSMRASDRLPTRAVRGTHTDIVRTSLRPRITWVRTKRGLVKKTVSRTLVRKTVRKTVRTTCST